MQDHRTFDVVIIGSGAAGLALALSLAADAHVAIVSKDQLIAGSSPHAQGGIAAVLNNPVDIQQHIEDTLKAGAGLCDRHVVELTIKSAQAAIEWLIQQGVQFNLAANQQPHFTQEGGHSHRRILHVADKTGSAVIKTLVDQVISHPNVHCFDQHTAIDLFVKDNRCHGLQVLNNLTGQMQLYKARATVLATGGASQIYQYSTNPEVTSGDGIAIAHRAGAVIKNLEFNQFHPTSLYTTGQQKRFLITEAIRGEGALLLAQDGTRFMPAIDHRAELAPRDIVARAIVQQIQMQTNEYIYLDLSPINKKTILSHFPTVYQHCLAHQIDITRDKIPVVPAAHYTCGGVVTDINAQTNIQQLYAIGEVACTGLHGANRLASNSLLECLVFARTAAQHIQQHIESYQLTSNHHFNTPLTTQLETLDAQQHIQSIQKIMWDQVGIIRTNAGLQQAKQKINALATELTPPLKGACHNRQAIELHNMILVAQLTIQAALDRKKNCGLHYNVDNTMSLV